MASYNGIGRDILVADKCFKAFLKNAIKQYGLNTAEGMVLLVLYSKDIRTADEIRKNSDTHGLGSTQDEIIEELSYDKGVMARTMQSLECKGYAQRNCNPQDSRSFLFTQTVKAAEFKPLLITVLREWQDILLKDVENLEVVQQALRKMAENAKNSLKQNRE